jgi:CO/xanthine dehydrogenase Mo-binding subunit
MVAVYDCGKAIDASSCEGQQYGGSYMGVGRTFTEGIKHDPQTGVKLNDNLIGYAIATIDDCGPIDCHLIETGLAYGPYGHTGLGENPGAVVSTMGSTAVYNAIGVYIDDLPITPDKVLKALGKA